MTQSERFEDAAAHFEQAPKLEPSLKEAARQIDICRFKLKDYPAARELFTRLSTDPSNRDSADYYLGRIALKQGDPAATYLGALARRHSPEPFQDEALYLGIAEYRSRLFPAAADNFRLAMRQNQRDFRTHQWLARTLQNLGRDHEAVSEFSDAGGSVAIGRCRSLLMQGKAEEAWADSWPLIDTDDVDKLTAIGILFGTAGDSRAHRKTGNARLLWTRNPLSCSTTCLTSTFNLRDLPNARIHAARALPLWPDFANAAILYGTILYMVRQDQEAEKVLTKAHQLRSADPAVNQLLAELHAHPGGGG